MVQETDGRTPDEDEDRIIQWDYDPLQEEEMVAKLVFNAYVESAPEYNVEAGRGILEREALYPIIQWRQVFEDQTRTNEEGKPRIYSQNINCEFVMQQDDKWIKRRFGRNSAPNQLANAFKKIDVAISPADPTSEAVIGHFFTLVKRDVPMGPNFSKRVWFPTQYHGETLPDNITPVEATEATPAESSTW